MNRAPGGGHEQLQRSQVRDIVRRWGWNSTAYQILNPGFTYWVDPKHEATVGYVDRRGIRVVGGAPVCADDRLHEVLEAFEDDAAAENRRVVYFCAESRIAELAARDRNRVTFSIGSQPSWRPGELLREFASHSSLRAQLNRARNKGVTVRRMSSVDLTHASALRDCLDQWMKERPLPPLHFLVETETLEELSDRILHVAYRSGKIVGFTVATPIPARNGWLIEQIVRTRNSPNGTAEILLYHTTMTLHGEGASMMTLGLAPLARRAIPVIDQAPPWMNAILNALRAHGRRFYNFEGLEAFKAKFGGAEWAPVYVSLAPGTRLPRALIAITDAFTGVSVWWFVPHMFARAILRETRRMFAL